MKKIISLLMPFLLLGCTNMKNPQIISYCSKVQFTQNQQIHFPDFNIEFIGKKDIGTVIPPFGPDHDFKIKKGNEEKIISWNSGTGDIGPIHFEMEGKKYSLEMYRSDTLGNLKENEFVICPK